VKHCWFKHTTIQIKNLKEFLVFVEVMEEHSVTDYDPCIAVDKMCKSSFKKNPARTVRSPNFCNQYQSYHRTDWFNSLEYKVIAPSYIFNENNRLTAGDICNLYRLFFFIYR
jgi:hypothetical protein